MCDTAAVRTPQKTVPDGHRTTPLIKLPQSSIPPPRDGKPKLPVLVVLSGEQVGERVALQARTEIGRDRRCHLQLRDPLIAMQHVTIEETRSASRWNLTAHTGAMTKLHGSWVGSHETHELRAGDELQLGDTLIRLELHDEVEQEFDRIVVQRLQTDELTGLLSRRKFEQEFDALLEQSQGGLVLVLLDIDGLKRVNDTHGHLAGASVISTTGRVIRRVLGSRGIGARLGGDELAVALFLPPDQALEAVEAMLEAVAFTPFEHEGARISVTISAGLAWGTAERVAESADSPRIAMMARADKALFEAKRRGGNTAICAPPASPGEG